MVNDAARDSGRRNGVRGKEEASTMPSESNGAATALIAQTPPMRDPALQKMQRLTPNIKEMIRGLNTSTPDIMQGPLADMLRSPDQSSVFACMQANTPGLRDLFQSSVSLDKFLSSTDGEDDSQRHDEMQVLFNACTNMGSPDQSHDEELENGDEALSMLSSTDEHQTFADTVVGTSDGSPGTSGTERSPGCLSESLTPVCRQPDVSNAHNPGAAVTKSGGKPWKAKKRGSSVVQVTPTPTPGSAVSKAPTPSMIPLPVPVGVNRPSFPFSMHPFGTMHYQGRPMALVQGMNGPELVPMDMQCHIQAVAPSSRAVHPTSAGTPQTELVPSSARKRRRRQTADGNMCSVEQARRNRARALERLREKKSLRKYAKTVRYACRKKIAMVRPRVNGRFATKEEVEHYRRSGRFVA